MSNPDAGKPHVEKLKRKNDTHAARKRRIGLIITIIFLIVVASITAILKSDKFRDVILDGSTAPVIDGVDIQRDYADNSVTVNMTIRFHDSEGDIDILNMEVFGVRQNFGRIYNIDIEDSPLAQHWGASYSTSLTCSNSGFEILVVLIDQQGNHSNSYDETIQCFSPDVISTMRAQVTPMR